MTTTKVTLEDITDTIFSRDNINKQQTYHQIYQSSNYFSISQHGKIGDI